MTITIYGHARCVWCKKAVALAEQYNLAVDYRDTDKEGVLEELKSKLPNAKTVPQVFWDDRHIGGYSDLATEIESTIGNYGQGAL
ncbi:MAG: glutaredoxin [Anaerolineaceae bacterium]